MDNQTTFTRKVVIITCLVLLLLGLVILVIYAISFFFLVFGGILFAVLLRAMTNWLVDKTRMPDWLGLTLSNLFFFGVIFLTGWFIAPTIREQVQELRQTLPDSLENLQEQLGQTQWGEEAMTQLSDTEEGILPDTGELIGRAGNVFTSTLNIITNLLIVLVVGIFFAANPTGYREGMVRLFPPANRARLREVMEQAYETLKWFVVGKLATMAFVAVLTGAGLMWLGVPMALALAVILFFLDFIPTVGPIIAAIPAVLIAFLDSPQMALYVALLYFAVQSLESYVLAPIIFQHTVAISPVAMLLSLVLFGILVGPLGVILSAPLVAVLQVFVRELYIKDYLEEGRSKEEAERRVQPQP